MPFIHSSEFCVNMLSPWVSVPLLKPLTLSEANVRFLGDVDISYTRKKRSWRDELDYELRDGEVPQRPVKVPRLQRRWTTEEHFIIRSEIVPNGLQILTEGDTGAKRELEVYQDIYRVLHRMGPLSELQIEFADQIIAGALPRIFRTSWDKMKGPVMQERNMAHIWTLIFCTAPRRFGKTHVMSQTMASLICCVPKYTIFTYGQTRDTSQQMLNNIYVFAESVDFNGLMVIMHNTEKLVIAKGKDKRWVHAKSSNAKVNFFSQLI